MCSRCNLSRLVRVAAAAAASAQLRAQARDKPSGNDVPVSFIANAKESVRARSFMASNQRDNPPAPPLLLSFAQLVQLEQQADWRQAIVYRCPRCQGQYTVDDGSVLCCSMFEPEAIESLQISTASSGCKFYHRVSWPGKTGNFDSAVRFGCSFSRRAMRRKRTVMTMNLGLLRGVHQDISTLAVVKLQSSCTEQRYKMHPKDQCFLAFVSMRRSRMAKTQEGSPVIDFSSTCLSTFLKAVMQFKFIT